MAVPLPSSAVPLFTELPSPKSVTVSNFHRNQRAPVTGSYVYWLV
jgi:hypothetical protein